MVTALHIAARVAEKSSDQCAEEAKLCGEKITSQEICGEEEVAQQEQVGYIKKTPGKGYCVKSEKNPDWSGGCYPTKGEAKKRLQQVEVFKHMKKGSGEAPESQYYFHVIRDGVVIGTMTYTASSPEEAKQKIPQLFKLPPGGHVSIDGPYPGSGE